MTRKGFSMRPSLPQPLRFVSNGIQRRPAALALALVAMLGVAVPSAYGADDSGGALPADMEAIEKAYLAGDYETARAALIALADDSASPVVWYRLGHMLAEGRGGAQDLEAAKAWLGKALEADYADARTLLGRILLSGDESEAARAVALLGEAAAAGDATAQYALANAAMRGIGMEADLAEARRLFEASAEAGNARAQYALSQFYDKGIDGGVQDSAKALALLQAAAGQGNAWAQFDLARRLGDPASGLAPDEALADRLLKSAAQGGHPQALAIVGMQTLQGRSPDIAPDAGLAMLQASAGMGDPIGQNNLGWAYATGTGVTQDDVAAARLYGQAADAGYLPAALVMASFFEAGRGVPQDMARAVALYLEAAEKESPAALAHLGRLSAQGDLPQELASHSDHGAWLRLAALQWPDSDAAAMVLEAAQAGDPAAQLWMLEIVEARDAPEAADLAMAVGFLESAAQAGEPQAQFRLGQLFARGDHVAQDFVKAHGWTNLAAAGGYPGAREARGALADLMTPEQIAEAQAMARALLSGARQ
ncbi:tetratricopeptide repeat protein [Pseudoruegeria sp. SHC-113]|uniref:tetratricopeptide repeat protein n=1 Tax=Pseudoruegeria sp. SHC-113 TaxID=2855439 RepID=UPI0021BB24E0|nr:hypothetical protein [Pseudoruegeria sp. SHC-113]MCT8161677.1 SEL1-like repeat protein [Pseudoruegeria sp. SHC-113]